MCNKNPEILKVLIEKGADTVIKDKEAGGYWGECPELPGCFSQGETIDELMEHMKEAAKLYLYEPEGAEIQPVREIRELVL